MRKNLLVIPVFLLLTLLSSAKDTSPLKDWEFVAVISRHIDGSVSIIVLKDDNKLFEQQDSIDSLRDRFKNMNPLGNTGWVYSMKFTNGKRREILKNVGDQFCKDIERNFSPFSKLPKLP